MEALAGKSDVEAAFGRDLTPDEATRVGAILDKASELFRAAAGQQFTLGDSISRLKVNGGRVHLPLRPVIEVQSVTMDSGADVRYSRFKQWLDIDLPSSEFVRVTYSHGGDVPDLVRLTVAEVAKKVLSIDPNAAAGVSQTSESTGPFSGSQSYATWAQGGQTMLAPDDLAIARSFRVRVPTVWVSRL